MTLGISKDLMKGEFSRLVTFSGNTPVSTGERIAAALVLNELKYLPDMYADIIEAWDRLDDVWKVYVRLIKRDYMHLTTKAE